MKYVRLCEILAKYIPEPLVKDAAEIIVEHKVMLKIKRPRTSKLGDYRSPAFDGRHTISINQDLNQYAFAVTLFHELAHLLCFNAHKNKVKPHGAEWKAFFVTIMKPHLNSGALPATIATALSSYLKNPAASSCADAGLMKALTLYDKIPSLFLEDLSANEAFELDNGQRFIKGEKRRTRYICSCLDTKRAYLVSGVAKIKRIV